MATLPALVTFRELLAATKVGGRKLRSVIRELGYRPPARGQKLLFTIEDARRIQDALVCKAPAQAPGAAERQPGKNRSEKVRETKRLLSDIRHPTTDGSK